MPESPSPTPPPQAGEGRSDELSREFQACSMALRQPTDSHGSPLSRLRGRGWGGGLRLEQTFATGTIQGGVLPITNPRHRRRGPEKERDQTASHLLATD